MDPAKHLGAITVMFRREAGYDDDNADWFWAKFLPDGSLDKNAMGGSLAGRVAKGMDTGCIACHSGEDDYVFPNGDATIGAVTENRELYAALRKQLIQEQAAHLGLPEEFIRTIT